MTDDYKNFYDHWRNRAYGSGLRKRFPYKLSLGVPGPMGADNTSNSEIVVTSAYHEMYYRILGFRKRSASAVRNGGIVLTGQPGVGASLWLNSYLCNNSPVFHCPGKTLFLDFMLLRLMSANQVVLLFTGSALYLFCDEHVYMRVPGYFLNLPTFQGASRFPIWTLVDADDLNHAPPINVSQNIWPIQASSPNPNRWNTWSKRRDAALLGMPLWDIHELMEGYVTVIHVVLR